MRCSCPKCNAAIIEELPEIPAEGIFLACPQCHASLNLKRESFARRALQKETEISCAECGSEPGPSIYCQNCHAIYADYLLAESSSAAKKQLGKIARLFNRDLSRHAESHHVHKTQAPVKGIKLPSQPLQLAAILLILVAVLGGSGVYYYLNKIEAEYIGRYIRALHTINTAEEYNITLASKIETDLKAGLPPGAPILSAVEQTILSRGLKDAGLVTTNLGKPPEKYVTSNAALGQLFEKYKQHQALVASLTSAPAGGAEAFADSSQKLKADYRKSAIALKAGLPEKLSDKLTVAKAKYKELQSF